MRLILAPLTLLLVFAVAIEAQTPDGRTPAVETVCDAEPHGLKGLCNAFCEAMDCDSGAHASDTACDAVLRNYHRRSGGINPPCLRAALYGTDGFSLYTIDPETALTTLVGGHGVVGTFIGGLDFNGETLYGLSAGDTATAMLYTIDRITGAATAVGPLDIGDVYEGGLAFDVTGMLFGVNQGGEFASYAFTIDRATGMATILGPAGGDARDLNGLAFDGPTLYALDRPSNTLGTVDVFTGSYSPIGVLGLLVGDEGGLAIDPLDRTLYGVASGTSELFTLDKSTGIATVIGPTPANRGLAFYRP